MNKIYVWIAAALAGLTAGVHVFIGTPEIQEPLLRSQLPREIALLLYACWHLVSVTLCLSSAALALAARRPTNPSMIPLVRFVGASWTGFGLTFIVVALAMSGTDMALKLPQWTLLLPVGILCAIGSLKPKIPSNGTGESNPTGRAVEARTTTIVSFLP